MSGLSLYQNVWVCWTSAGQMQELQGALGTSYQLTEIVFGFISIGFLFASKSSQALFPVR